MPHLQPVLTRHLHQLKPRRLTTEAIDALPATLTLKLERLATQPATSLREHELSLPIRCMGVPARRGDADRPVNFAALTKNAGFLCRTLLAVMQVIGSSGIAKVGRGSDALAPESRSIPILPRLQKEQA
jgi:hypothetical protein